MESKFDNLKTKARKVVAAEKSYMKGTGGGEYRGKNGNPIIEAVVNIILRQWWGCSQILTLMQ
jgi:hypothetical protein